MCEVEFLGGVSCLTKVRRRFLCGAAYSTYPYCQIGALESILYYLVQFVKVLFFILPCLHVTAWREQPPISSGPHRYKTMGDAGVIEQMLLDGNTALLLVKLSARFAAPEPNIKIGYPLVEDIAVQRRLDFTIPHRLGVKVKVAAKTTGQNNAAGKLVPQLYRYCQPVFVVELAFKVVHDTRLVLTTRVPLCRLVFNGSGLFVFVGYPLVSTNLTIIPTVTHDNTYF